jgi:hypothetical protein
MVAQTCVRMICSRVRGLSGHPVFKPSDIGQNYLRKACFFILSSLYIYILLFLLCDQEESESRLDFHFRILQKTFFNCIFFYFFFSFTFSALSSNLETSKYRYPYESKCLSRNITFKQQSHILIKIAVTFIG